MEEFIIISRRTAIALGEVYETKYTFHSHYSGGNISFKVYNDSLYDYLFENNYPSWFCNKAKRLSNRQRQVKEVIMRLHTGETQSKATSNWTWDQRKQLGQEYLYDLAEDILVYYHDLPSESSKEKIKKQIEKLTDNLELDGYIFHNKNLLIPETDILEIEEEIGVLETLYNSLKLDGKELSLHHLKLSEEHYLAKKWDDAISNSRKFLENILREVASTHSQRCKNDQLKKSIYESPFKVRNYLEEEGLLETKEKEAVAKIYGLLSNTGGHPYMASNDQARLLRQLALTLSHFVMLRFDGYLKTI